METQTKDTAVTQEFQTVDISLIAAGCCCLCRHCFANASRRVADPINVTKAEEIVEYFEPLLTAANEPLVDVCYDLFDHPDAPGMIRMLHRRGLYGYFDVIPTNGHGIAHNPEYARFLGEMREMGTQRLQVTFHGMEKNHDRFVRRRGAFQDLLVAARAGLDVGLELNIATFANRHNVDELPALAEHLLHAGVRTHPDKPLFVGIWSPPEHDRKMEALVIDLDDCKRMKEQPNLRMIGVGRTEGEWLEEALRGDHSAFVSRTQNCLSVAVYGNFDVTAGFDRRSRIGNLRTDSLETIAQSHGRSRAQQPIYSIGEEIRREGQSERILRIAREFGQPDGIKMYRDGGHALQTWIHRMNQAE